MPAGSLEFRQKIGKAERHRQAITTGEVVNSAWMVKGGKKTAKADLVRGVIGVPSTVCPVPARSEFSSMHLLESHWADYHELYIWYYYCKLCKTWQKLAREAVGHMKEHVTTPQALLVCGWQLWQDLTTLPSS